MFFSTTTKVCRRVLENKKIYVLVFKIVLTTKMWCTPSNVYALLRTGMWIGCHRCAKTFTVTTLITGTGIEYTTFQIQFNWHFSMTLLQKKNSGNKRNKWQGIKKKKKQEIRNKLWVEMKNFNYITIKWYNYTSVGSTRSPTTNSMQYNRNS